MSGHNKWSKIKHKKGAEDARRSRVFTKVTKEITVAARMGGGDPDGNPRLRMALSAARAANMPGDNVERAIKKGTGELEGVTYEDVMYEGFGTDGVAMLIEAVTDNINRTVSEIRSIFNKRGGRLGEKGSVSWLFQSKGRIAIDKEGVDFDRLFELALEAGAEDVQDAGDQWLVLTSREDLYAVTNALEAAEIEPEEAKLAQIPTTTVELTDVETAQKVMRLIDAIEELDDVAHVYANFDVSEDVGKALAED